MPAPCRRPGRRRRGRHRHPVADARRPRRSPRPSPVRTSNVPRSSRSRRPSCSVAPAGRPVAASTARRSGHGGQVAHGQGQGVGHVGRAVGGSASPSTGPPCAAPAPWSAPRSRPAPASPRWPCTGRPRSPPRPPPPGPAAGLADRHGRLALTWKKTRSTTTASGGSSATRARSSSCRLQQPLGQRHRRVGRDHPAGHGRRRACPRAG